MLKMFTGILLMMAVMAWCSVKESFGKRESVLNVVYEME